MRLSVAFATIVLSCLFSTTARALIIGGPTKDPVTDRNWPIGTVELANLPSRIGWIEGPPFGGGEWTFYYQGDAAALQTAVDRLAALRTGRVELVVHSGPNRNSMMRQREAPPGGGSVEIKPDPANDPLIDWTFTVWVPENWYRLHTSERVASMTASRNDGSSRVPPPRMDAYVGAGGIDFSKIKVPANVAITDERASAAGFNAGPVVSGDVFDMTTSKPIAGARIAIEKLESQAKYALVSEGTSDKDGHFTIQGFATGSVRIVVSADRYAPRHLGYETFVQDTLKRYAVNLSEATSISGKVLDLAGAPVAKATIRTLSSFGRDGVLYQGLEESIHATSDDNGAFALKNVPMGYVTLICASATMYPVDLDRRIPAPSGDVVVRMTATGAIGGRLVGEVAGRNPGHQTIYLYARGNPTGYATVQVAQLGQWFKFDGVPAGEYYVTTDMRSYEDRSGVNATAVQVKPGETAEVDVTWSR